MSVTVTNRYSILAGFANRPVSLRVCPDHLVIVAEANVVATHERVFCRDHSTSGETIYDWRHYLSVVQRKPGALRNDSPFSDLPVGFRRLQALLLKRPGGDREMVDVLAPVLLHDERLVKQAITTALQVERLPKLHVLQDTPGHRHRGTGQPGRSFFAAKPGSALSANQQ